MYLMLYVKNSNKKLLKLLFPIFNTLTTMNEPIKANKKN
jgi:hypothetical protein